MSFEISSTTASDDDVGCGVVRHEFALTVLIYDLLSFGAEMFNKIIAFWGQKFARCMKRKGVAPPQPRT